MYRAHISTIPLHMTHHNKILPFAQYSFSTEFSEFLSRSASYDVWRHDTSLQSPSHEQSGCCYAYQLIRIHIGLDYSLKICSDFNIFEDSKDKKFCDFWKLDLWRLSIIATKNSLMTLLFRVPAMNGVATAIPSNVSVFTLVCITAWKYGAISAYLRTILSKDKKFCGFPQLDLLRLSLMIALQAIPRDNASYKDVSSTISIQ